jgi:hypothetical protein
MTDERKPDAVFEDSYERMAAQGEIINNQYEQWWDSLTPEEKEAEYEEIKKRRAAFAACWPDNDSYCADLRKVTDILEPYVKGTREEMSVEDFASEALEYAAVNGTSLEEEIEKEIEYIKNLLREQSAA